MTKEEKSVFVATTQFEKTQAFSRCQALAEKPLDLSQEGVVTKERVQKMVCEGAGYRLFYGFEKVDTEVLQALEALAKERQAVEQMHAMQNGVVCNFLHNISSENRAVLHTAMRDLFSERPVQDAAKKAREMAKKEHIKLKNFIDKVDREGKFSEMIFIGIGGSELGPKALYMGLSFYHKKGRKIHFVCNVDPDDVAQAVQKAELKNTLVVVISKSGTTLETATNEEFVRSYFVKAGLDPKEHFVAVTMPHTPMDDEKKYLACFHIWDFVGGRYSATSMVGGLLLSFGVGYDAFVELLQGAHDMDQEAMKTHVFQNLPLMLALLGIWNRNFLGYPTVATIPYSQMLFRFPAHLQQCDMESNGKRVDRHGAATSFQTSPVIWGEPGTNAQHSFYQMIHQGTDVVPLEFIGFRESQGGVDFMWNNTTSQEKLLSNLCAQAIALATGKNNENPNKQFPGNRPSCLIIGKKLTPYALGALLSLYENKIAFQGFIWGVNSFDQEGVQLGKVLADKTLNLYEEKRSGKSAEPFILGKTLIEMI